MLQYVEKFTFGIVKYLMKVLSELLSINTESVHSPAELAKPPVKLIEAVIASLY